MKNKGMFFWVMGLLCAGVVLFVSSANAGSRGSSGGSAGRTETPSSGRQQVILPQRSEPDMEIMNPKAASPPDDVKPGQPKATEPLDKVGPNEPVEIKKGYFKKKTLGTKVQPKATEPLDKPGGGSTGQVKASSPPDDSKPGQVKAGAPPDDIKPGQVKASSPPDDVKPLSAGQTEGQAAQ
jgi:hypothetical protein